MMSVVKWTSGLEGIICIMDSKFQTYRLIMNFAFIFKVPLFGS